MERTRGPEDLSPMGNNPGDTQEPDTACDDVDKSKGEDKNSKLEREIQCSEESVRPHQSTDSNNESQTNDEPCNKDSVGRVLCNDLNSKKQSMPSLFQMTVEQQLAKAKKDLEAMVMSYAKSEQNNLRNKQKVEDLERKLVRVIKDNDQLADRIKIQAVDKDQLIATMSEKVAKLTVLEQRKSQLDEFQGSKQEEYEKKIAKLEACNNDSTRQIDGFKVKQAELLEFSELLAMKYMLLQTELGEINKHGPDYKEQCNALSTDRNRLLENCQRLGDQVANLEQQLNLERELTRNLRDERAIAEAQVSSNIGKLENELKFMKRKHLMSTKALVREIKLLQSNLSKTVSLGG